MYNLTGKKDMELGRSEQLFSFLLLLFFFFIVLFCFWVSSRLQRQFIDGLNLKGFLPMSLYAWGLSYHNAEISERDWEVSVNEMFFSYLD
jgi:hypothetical protein